MTGITPTLRSDIDAVRAALADDYEIIEELGRGGMAIVYRARDRHLDRDVAIKVLPFSLAHDAEVVERFQREARLSASLEHPNIVPIYRVGQRGDVIYFVMKLVRGQSLSTRITMRGRLSAAEVRRVLLETASALGTAHRRGIVHRDVKPDNIMLDEDGRCVVMDFGIARSASDTKLTASGMSLGTPRYMSPEQARGRDLDGRSDLYSLGVVGYHCLVGRAPFDTGDSMAILLDHIQTPVPRPEIASGGTADERVVYSVIDRLLAKSARDRYDDAEQLIAALESATAASARMSDEDRTRPVPQVDPTAPQPRASAALDAGLDLLRRQQPKVAAGAAATRQFVGENAPRVGRAMERGAHSAAGLARRGWATLQPVIATGVARVRARGPKPWLLVGGVLAVAWIGVAGTRYALLQRSRCPVTATGPGVGDFVPGGAPAKRSFTVLVDRPGPLRQGHDFDAYYDVCGMESGSVRTQIIVVRNESALRRIFGGGATEPISRGYDETVSGPRTRRHHAVDFSGMPAGSYRLEVLVSDARGRRRDAATDFIVRP